MLSLSANATPILHSRPGLFYKLYIDSTTAPWLGATDDRVSQVWQIVAGMYAPFNVDVTTERPAWQTHCAWVVVGGPLQGAIAGRSGLGSWGQGMTNGPDFASQVYADGIGADTNLVAWGICHESGHAFGLDHQDDGVMSPILGSGGLYWGKGVTPSGAYQDSYAMLGATLGFAAPTPEPPTWFLLAALPLFWKRNRRRRSCLRPGVDRG